MSPAWSRQETLAEACDVIPACKSGMTVAVLHAPGDTGTCQAPLPQRLSHTTAPSGFTDTVTFLLARTSLQSSERACASLIQTAGTKPNTYKSQYRKQALESRFNVIEVKQQQQKSPDALWIMYFIVPKRENVLDWRQLYTDQTCDLHEAKSPGRKRRRGLLWLGQDSYLCQGELREK